MSIFQWAQNPWGQEILVRISWDLLYLAIAGGLAFVIGHFLYRFKNPPKPAEAGDAGAAGKDIPEKVVRHSLAARLFHWVMAITMITLLVTAFFPIMGIQFNWVPIHWMAGVVLTLAIIFHIIHASFWLKLRNIWISAKDWAEWKQEMEYALGKGEPPPKTDKYPVDHRL